MKDYDQDLLLNWDQSIEKFLSWLQNICGISPSLYMKIVKNVNTREKLIVWVDIFDGNIDEKALDATTELYIERSNAIFV